MSGINSQKGFTLTEIMIALAIMALGFLAMAQMQYLSLRQKQQAELGTVATNVVQFIADRDMEEVKRAQLLNSTAFMKAQAGRLDPSSYCLSGNLERMCDACPCDPLAEVTPHPSQETETTCAVIDITDFDPEKVVFKTTEAGCSGSTDDSLIVIKRVNSKTVEPADPNEPTVTTLNVTYGIKTKNQFEETGFDSLSIKDTLATQDMVFTAHEEDWSQYLVGWSHVNVPHVP